MKANPMPKITKRAVDALRPDLSGKDVWMWDEGDGAIKGFGIRVKKSGAKAFLIQYRNKHGNTRRMVIGKVGTITTDKARALARKELGKVAVGADPSADRHIARNATTVAEVCDWYIKEAKAGHILGRQGRSIKASTLAMDLSRIETHVKPLIGRRAVPSLMTSDLEKMQSDIAAGKTRKACSPERRQRGGVATGGATVAGRTLGMLGTIFSHAVRARLIQLNPAKGARLIKAPKRVARLSLEQIGALGKVMREAESENATGLAAIRLILLTGLRREEALAIKRSWLIEAGGINFPDTKSDAQVRPVGQAAMDLLKARSESVGGDREWLFPADRGEGHFIGVRKVLGRVCKKAGLAGVTPHILRHTFASVVGDIGYTELTIARLLGHASKGVTQGYVHLDHALVDAADRASSVIAEALDGRPGAEIVAKPSLRLDRD